MSQIAELYLKLGNKKSRCYTVVDKGYLSFEDLEGNEVYYTEFEFIQQDIIHLMRKPWMDIQLLSKVFKLCVKSNSLNKDQKQYIKGLRHGMGFVFYEYDNEFLKKIKDSL